jgi:hypothetical protein
MIVDSVLEVIPMKRVKENGLLLGIVFLAGVSAAQVTASELSSRAGVNAVMATVALDKEPVDKPKDPPDKPTKPDPPDRPTPSPTGKPDGR